MVKNRFEKTVNENHAKTIKVIFWTLVFVFVFSLVSGKKIALTLRVALINKSIN